MDYVVTGAIAIILIAAAALISAAARKGPSKSEQRDMVAEYPSLVAERDKLEGQLIALQGEVVRTRDGIAAEVRAELEERHQAQVDRLLQKMEYLAENAYRVPNLPNWRMIQTFIGPVTLQIGGNGYYHDCGVFVFFPNNYTLTDEVKERFRRATGNRYVMETAPGVNSGGIDTADYIISGGRDHEAFMRGEANYFKNITVDLDEVSMILSEVLNSVPASV